MRQSTTLLYDVIISLPPRNQIAGSIFSGQEVRTKNYNFFLRKYNFKLHNRDDIISRMKIDRDLNKLNPNYEL